MGPDRRSIAAYAALVAWFVAATLGREPFDDALFVKRTALNLLEHGALVWNLKDGPVHGATSQTFQLLVVPLVAAFRDHALLAVRVVLAACLVLGYAAALRAGSEGSRAPITLCFCSPPVLYTAISGMETALVVALVAWFVHWLSKPEPGAQRWWLGALWIGLLYATRPDSVLLALPLWSFFAWQRSGRLPVREALAAGAALLALLIAFRLHYGSALPLPAYAKLSALSPYDHEFRARSAAVAIEHFGSFSAVALPLVLVALGRRDRVTWALLGSVASFVLYQLAATIDVMGMQARFYVPALPVLALAASRAPIARRPLAVGVFGAWLLVLGLGGWLPTANDTPIWGVPWPLYLSAFAGGAALLWGAREASSAALLAAAAGVVVSFGLPRPRLHDDAAYLRIASSHVTSFRGMVPLRECLGDAIHVYHSELGVTGLTFQRGTVTDLAGLWSPDWLWRRASADALCARDRPEAIFLPHSNYAALNRQLAHSRCLDGYTRVVEASSSPLHVRNDLLARYRECAERRR